MHSVSFLQDLAVVMIAAAAVTVIFHRFKQPVVLGYIIAGVLIGPFTPAAGLIHDQQTIDTLAELGIILLMFSLGLEFNLRKLTKVGMPALVAALLEILLLFWAGYEIGRFFGWRLLDSIFLGAMLSMSSTTIIIKVLGELGRMKEQFAQVIFGILVLEDILGIAIIALLSGIAMTGRLSAEDVGLTLGKLGMFLAVTLVAGLLTVPRLIGYVSRFKSNEMLIVTVLGLCFGVSLLAVRLGYSVALGAFLIGAVIAEAREIHRIEALLEPVRDMFSAIFFVAIGLLIHPGMLVTYWKPVLVVTLAVIVGKVLTCSFGAFLGGNDTRTSLRVGMGLAQIGEFSFIIATLGVTLKVTSDFLYPVAVAVSAVTSFLSPYFIRSADSVADWFERAAPRPLVNSLNIYTRWMGQFGSQRHRNLASKLVRRWSLQMGLNVVLVAAVFVSAAYIERHRPAWLQDLGLGDQAVKAVLWSAAVILSLPLVVATFRKLQAFGLLVAETRVSEALAGERTAAIRAIVAQVVPVAGTVILAIFLLALSSTLLPSWEIFLVLLVLVALVTWLLWRSSIRIYSKAQAALEETLRQPPAPRPNTAPGALLSLLGNANLETLTLGADSPAARKLIRELELRTRTGASVVGIERGGTQLINPGPDEELLPGDQVLLLGTRLQLDAAKAELGNGAKKESREPHPPQS